MDSGHLNFNYRMSAIKKSDGIVLKVFLKLKKIPAPDAKTAMDEAMEIVKNRISKQPKGKCSGSFFKNPGELDPDQKMKAGYLLEHSGCKGLQIGQVKVSDQHANWLMNLGGGTQKDVLALCKLCQKNVRVKFGIELEREVQLVNETGFLND